MEGLGQSAPHQRPGGVSGNVLHRSQRERMEMDSAPSQSKHLQEGSEGSTPMDQDRRIMGFRDVEATMFMPHTPGEELMHEEGASKGR